AAGLECLANQWTQPGSEIAAEEASRTAAVIWTRFIGIIIIARDVPCQQVFWFSNAGRAVLQLDSQLAGFPGQKYRTAIRPANAEGGSQRAKPQAPAGTPGGGTARYLYE